MEIIDNDGLLILKSDGKKMGGINIVKEEVSQRD